MRLDGDSQAAIDLFWQQCGDVEPFPRSLERSLALALPVTLVKLPRLQLRTVEGWLQRRGVAFTFDCRSRAVRGCLVAFGGQGLIFIDGADPDDVLRFSLAHEIAHFLVDYWQPRRQAIEKFGDAIAEVIDGFRPPSAGERVQALLVGAPIGVHTDLLERDDEHGEASSGVWAIEDRADRIALALLAPPQAVLQQVDLSRPRFEQRQEGVTAVLCDRFGLPPAVARSYSWSLLAAIGKGPSWVESLRIG